MLTKRKQKTTTNTSQTLQQQYKSNQKQQQYKSNLYNNNTSPTKTKQYKQTLLSLVRVKFQKIIMLNIE